MATPPTSSPVPSSPQFEIIGEPTVTEGKLVTVQIKTHDRYYTLTIDFKKPIDPAERDKFMKSASTKSKIEAMVQQRLIFSEIYSNRDVPKEFKIVSRADQSDVYIKTKDKSGKFKEEVSVTEKFEKWKGKAALPQGASAPDEASKAKIEKAQSKMNQYNVAKTRVNDQFSKAVKKAEETEKAATLSKADLALSGADINSLRERAYKLLEDPKINNGYMSDAEVDRHMEAAALGEWFVYSTLDKKTGLPTPMIALATHEDSYDVIDPRDSFDSTDHLEQLIALLNPTEGEEETEHTISSLDLVPQKMLHIRDEKCVGALTQQQAQQILKDSGIKNAGIRFFDSGTEKYVTLYTKGTDPAKAKMIDRTTALQGLTMQKFELWGEKTQQNVELELAEAPKQSYMVWKKSRVFGSAYYCSVRDAQGNVSHQKVKGPVEAYQKFGKDGDVERELWTPEKAWGALSYDQFEDHDNAVEGLVEAMQPGNWAVYSLEDRPDQFFILYLNEKKEPKVFETGSLVPTDWIGQDKGGVRLDPSKRIKEIEGSEEEEDEELEAEEDRGSSSVDLDESNEFRDFEELD